MNRRIWSSIALIIVALPAAAQQTGSITGKVTGKSGQGLAGVRINVTAKFCPSPARWSPPTTANSACPSLPPGEYVLTFTHQDKVPQKRAASVVLGQNTTANVMMPDASVAGTQVEVVPRRPPWWTPPPPS